MLLSLSNGYGFPQSGSYQAHILITVRRNENDSTVDGEAGCGFKGRFNGTNLVDELPRGNLNICSSCAAISLAVTIGRTAPEVTEVKPVTVATKYGTLELLMQTSKRAHVAGILTMSGIQWKISGSLELINGDWHLPNSYGMSIHRHGISSMDKNYSPNYTQQDRIVSFIKETFEEYLDGDGVRDGNTVDLNRLIVGVGSINADKERARLEYEEKLMNLDRHEAVIMHEIKLRAG